MTQFVLPAHSFDLWHDRAVFHLLTDPTDRERYLRNLRRALKLGGYFVLGAYADDGPPNCSGLEVERYSLEKMTDTMGADFVLVMQIHEEQQTSFGTTQNFQYALFRYIPSGDDD